MNIINEKDHYIRRMNTYNHELRRRNGELYEALRTIDPATAEALTPIADFDTRYVRIDRIVEAVHKLSDPGNDAEDDYYLLQELYELYDEYKNYWQHVAEERTTRKERAAKAVAARKDRA